MPNTKTLLAWYLPILFIIAVTPGFAQDQTNEASPPPPPPPPRDLLEVEDADELFERKRRGSPKHRTLTEAEFSQFVEILEQVKPQAADRVKALQERVGDRARFFVAHEFPRVVMFMDMKQRDPEMFEMRLEDLMLNRQTNRLAQTFRETRAAGEVDQARQIKAKLLAVVKKHFELRERIRAYEIAILQKRLEQLQSELQQRRQLADRIVADRVRHLIDDDETRW